MRRVLMTALATGAAIAFASPAFASDANCPTCVVNVDPTGTPLDNAIYGDDKTVNDAIHVFGSAPNNDTTDNVEFTGNVALHITSGHAQITDAASPGLITDVAINPDDVFSEFEFATQLAGTSGTVYVYYMLTGHSNTYNANTIADYFTGCGGYCGLAGAYTSGSNDNANYLLTGANYDGFLLATSNGTFTGIDLSTVKQLSYNGATPTRAVPEPGTWALMLLGFAGVGMTLRSRRRKDAHLAQIA